MAKRFLRALVGTLWLSTLIFTIIPTLILWIITGKTFVMELAEWIFDDDD
jgi:hypothetical protein